MRPFRYAILFAFTVALRIAGGDEDAKKEVAAKTEQPALHESLTPYEWLVGEWDVRANNQTAGGSGYYVADVSVRPLSDGKGLRVSYISGFTTGMVAFGRRVTDDILPTDDAAKFTGPVHAEGEQVYAGVTWNGQSTFIVKEKSANRISGSVRREWIASGEGFSPIGRRETATCDFDITKQEPANGDLEIAVVFPNAFKTPILNGTKGQETTVLSLKFRRHVERKSP